MIPPIYLIFAGLAVSRVASLSLVSPQTLTTLANISVSDTAFNKSNSTTRTENPSRGMLSIFSFKHLGSP